MQLNHPNIIKLYDYSFDEVNNNTYVILEYAENGTLFDYIKQN
jgi:serine/threonine protein kinase